MERNQTQNNSIISTLGEEIIRIITPVSICMFLVVILVSILNPNPSSSSESNSLITIANLAYDENNSDSFWEKLEGALLNALVFVAVVTVITFILVFLFYIRCTRFLKFYMGFSSFMVLCFMGGQMALMLVEKWDLPVDILTFLLVLFNFAVVGVLAVFMSKMAIFVTQSYLVVIGVFVAYYFTMLPEWTTWVLLISMAVYDLGAVLLPVGPLRLLVELAMSRDEDIPALVYEARPVNVDESSVGGQRRMWRDRRGGGEENGDRIRGIHLEMTTDQRRESRVGSGVSESGNRGVDLEMSVGSGASERDLADAEEGQAEVNNDREVSVPLIGNRLNVEPRVEEGVVSNESLAFEGLGLGSSGAVKLGLGDFIFYSVLVGRAAMYDYMTVYACYLAIIAGLGITLMLLALYQKALPALPVSIMMGVLFYVLTRTLLEEFVVQCSTNFVMF